MEKFNLGFMQGRLSPPIRNQIQAFPFLNWKNEFRIAKEINIKIMEWTIDNHNFSQNPIMRPGGIHKILQLKKKFNIKINSITCDFLMQDNFYKKKIFDKKKEMNFYNFLKNCNQAGIKMIVVPLVDKSSIKNLNEENNTTAFFCNFQNFLKKYKMVIAFESDFYPKKLIKFIEKFDPNFFGINYDIGNSAGLNFDYKMEMNSYHERIKNVHIKDKNQNNISVPLFSGKAKILEVITFLINHGYKGNFILQPARATFDHIDMIKNYLKIFKNYDY
tara:strand:- start:1494 stop:2318 length:825 start_codon:yes stop_codon:yes gene_type:complete